MTHSRHVAYLHRQPPLGLATAPVHLPSNVGGGRQGKAKGEPFRVKARPRRGTHLTEPVCAKGLNRACQENHRETRDEKDHSPHRKLPMPEFDQLRPQRSISRSRAKPVARYWRAPAPMRADVNGALRLRSAMQPFR